MAFAENVRFVLVGTQFPGNIGSSARAIKTMGFSNLVVVAPQCDPYAPDAVQLACNAEDILNNMRVVDTLEEALADTHFSVATTQKSRLHQVPFYTANQLGEVARPQAEEHQIAIVFGREASGLTNEEVTRCSVMSSVPAATHVPSLNLSQAVMVYAYEMYQATLTLERKQFEWNLAEHAELEQFYAHLERTLVTIDARPHSTMDQYIERFRRVFGRVPLEQRDVDLLHKLLKAMDKYAHRFPADVGSNNE